MKLNKKGFTLIELLTVMVILVTILLIAIPSITSSLSRSESKQIEEKKNMILADVYINVKKSDFKDSTEYNKFKTGTCILKVDKLYYPLGYITETAATNKKGESIGGCVAYNTSLEEYEYIEENDCKSKSECGLSETIR